MVICHRTTGPPDHRTTGPPDHRTTGPPDHRTTGPPDHRTTGPPDHRTTGPQDHRTTGPQDHRITGPLYSCIYPPGFMVMKMPQDHRTTVFLYLPTRVHGDEDATGPLEADLASLEHEASRSGCEGRQDRQDLLRHHRQHLDVDPIELVKTPPRTRLQHTPTDNVQPDSHRNNS